jgi:hypothetical protein
MKTNTLQLLAGGISEHVLRFIQMAGTFSENEGGRDRRIAEQWVGIFTRELAAGEVPVSGPDTQKLTHALITFSKSGGEAFLTLLGAKIDRSRKGLREAPYVVAGIFDALADFSYAANYGEKISTETPLESAKKILAKLLTVHYRHMDGNEKAALSGSVAACLKAWDAAVQDPVSPETSLAMIGMFHWIIGEAHRISESLSDGNLSRFGEAVADEVSWKLFAKISPRARLKALVSLAGKPSQPKK